jgi:hypothetical protein
MTIMVHLLNDSLLDKYGHDGFLSVQSVFRLIKDDTVRPIDDIISDLFAALGRQAVHDDAIRIGFGYKFGIDLKGAQALRLPCGLIFLTHGRPDIRINDVRAFHSFHGVIRDEDA